MEKKKYIAPAMEIVEIKMVSMIAASAGDIPVGGDGQGGGDALSNRRRGEWGNFWPDDEK